MAEEKKIEVKKETKSVVKAALKKTSGKGVQVVKVVSRIEKQYKEEVVPALMKEFNYSSIMECPKLVKIVLNMRLGADGTNNKNVEEAVKQLTLITGQKAVVTRARKSIANLN